MRHRLRLYYIQWAYRGTGDHFCACLSSLVECLGSLVWGACVWCVPWCPGTLLAGRRDSLSVRSDVLVRGFAAELRAAAGGELWALLPGRGGGCSAYHTPGRPRVLPCP